MSAPARCARRAVAGVMPPSTSIVASDTCRLNDRILSNVSGRNFCAAGPGCTASTWNSFTPAPLAPPAPPPKNGARCATFVSGLDESIAAAPRRAHLSAIAANVFTSTVSACTTNRLAPAASHGSMYFSGRSTMRCTSKAKGARRFAHSVGSAHDLWNVNAPSATSKCKRSPSRKNARAAATRSRTQERSEQLMTGITFMLLPFAPAAFRCPPPRAPGGQCSVSIFAIFWSRRA